MAVGAVRHRTRAIERWLAAPLILLRVPPNVVTLVTPVPAVAAAWALYGHHWWWALGCGALAALLDVADGTLARALDQVTPFGGFLDSVVDRVVDAAFLFGLGLAMASVAGWVAVGLATVGSFGTSYARARVYEFARPAAAVWHRGFERFERILVMALAVAAQAVADERGLGGPVLFSFTCVLALATLTTLALRVWTARRLLAGGHQPG